MTGFSPMVPTSVMTSVTGQAAMYGCKIDLEVGAG